METEIETDGETSISKEIEAGFKKFAKDKKVSNENIEDVLYEANVVDLLTDIIGEEKVSKLNLDLDKKMSYRKKLRDICFSQIGK